MAIIKCKMCGGNIEISADKTYGTCDSCGSTMTFPKVSDEQRVNLFNRANHFRRQNEFDKAIAAYERILEEDNTDAEAHWGVVLSRYGIEYVEDPVSHERIPTCHRVQLDSILTDADYLSAKENAPDAYSAELYEKEAKQIAEIQRGILAISAQEEPYDVFICYKESTDGGSRTKDSTIAQDIYYQLTGEGYKVFFSRITLEDKLGKQYEPYIFAALNSAKVMLVIGTRPEHFSAVWVKNEWSRYLALMRQDRSKLLIPCYRDMDPYDLPEELSALQSQDMSKIGFMQDLLRGIKKVLDADKMNEASHLIQQVVQGASEAAAPGISSLMERAYLFMEDGDFQSAGEYLNRVLDIDPKYAPAYVAKACVTFGMRKESDLAEATFLYEDNADWQKALRFADSAQKATYEGYIAKARERVNLQIRNYAFDCAVEMAINSGADRNRLKGMLEGYKKTCLYSNKQRANGKRRENSKQNEDSFHQAVRANEPGNVSEQNLKIAAEMFSAIRDEESAECAKQCLVLAEQARQKKIYQDALVKYNKERRNPVGLMKAAEIFRSIPNYKDALAQAQKCLDTAESFRSELYNKAMEYFKEAEDNKYRWDAVKFQLSNSYLDGYRDVDDLRKQAERRKEECVKAEKDAERRAAKKKKTTTICILVFIAVAIAAALLVTQVIIPKGHYDEAMRLRANGQWVEAIAEFVNAGNYSDAAEQIYATYYMEGEAKREAGDWGGAVTAFTNAGSYSDAKTRVSETYYAEGEAKREASDWDGAVTAFANAGSYSDAAEQVFATYYMEGEAKREASDWGGAVTAFANAGSYSDAATQITETHYQHAQAMIHVEDYLGAVKILLTIKDYRDVDSLLANDDNLAAAAAAAARDAMFSVGNYVTFGTYPQTKSGNDETPIEWLVLDRDGDNALLLSRYGLDVQTYNEEWKNITWEKCTLRTWLNDDFVNRAFTAEEQAAILLTNVDNSSSQGYSEWDTDGGNDTQDKIFLLSYAEANKYLGVTYDDENNTKSRVAPTAYALAQGAWTSDSNKTADGEAAGWWWLRSPGRRQRSASSVYGDGSLSSSGVDSVRSCIRPALWVNLESGIF